MNKTINCFVPYDSAAQVRETVKELKSCSMVDKVYLMATSAKDEVVEGCELMVVDSLTSTATMKAIAERATSDHVLVYTKYVTLQFVLFGIERLARVLEDSGAGMVYADHFNVSEGVRKPAPVIDYQKGSLRDDFDFGSVLYFQASAFKAAAALEGDDYKHAGLYDIRLKVSRTADLVHINEYLYNDIELDTRKSGEKLFDYVDPRNRARQIEMEQAVTAHLKAIGGYLAPKFKEVKFDKGEFEFEATVMIPVRNRIRTIRDAIRSMLTQKTNFKFNLIVVDNLSTDGTPEAVEEFASDPRLIHIVTDPTRTDYALGTYWNMAVHHPKCGKFIVQLDSDDIYEDENTLQTMVDAFYEQNCAMVVGSYTLTDINLNILPPGLVDHREWTPDNGRNNALRINGLGAPRAFYTPVLREINLPNVSYGEDYALGLAVSRDYQIGRVYKSVYCCRRWDDNSDADVNVEKQNRNNTYKDRVRTWELLARIAKNKKEA